MKYFKFQIEKTALEKLRMIVTREGRSVNEQICLIVQQHLNSPEIRKEMEHIHGCTDEHAPEA